MRHSSSMAWRKRVMTPSVAGRNVSVNNAIRTFYLYRADRGLSRSTWRKPGFGWRGALESRSGGLLRGLKPRLPNGTEAYRARGAGVRGRVARQIGAYAALGLEFFVWAHRPDHRRAQAHNLLFGPLRAGGLTGRIAVPGFEGAGPGIDERLDVRAFSAFGRCGRP